MHTVPVGELTSELLDIKSEGILLVYYKLLTIIGPQ